MEIDGNFRLPAEFEQHACTYLLWPVRPDNWRENATRAQSDLIKLANLLAIYERVRFGFSTEPSRNVTEQLQPPVQSVAIKYDDIWVRDTGPTFLVNDAGSAIAIDWEFNSWGGLFDEFIADNAVAQRIADLEGLRTIKAPIVLEGGAIATDGARTLLVTEESVINANRNPGLTRNEASNIFKNFLGVEKVIWLPLGLADDESGGHIDNVCAFADSRTILISDTSDRDHPSFERLAEIRKLLSFASNISGQSFQLVSLPLPPPTSISHDEAKGFAGAHGTIQRSGGTRLAPSHANLYVANGVVLLPTFGLGTDEAALEIARKVFPGRNVISFPSRELLLGGGAVHCVTRDIPETRQ